MTRKQSSTNRADTEAERQILKRILSEEYVVGMRLPNTAQLATQLELGSNAVQQALARLCAKGHLDRKPRLGTFVRRRNETRGDVIIMVGHNLMKEPHYMDRRLTACLEEELIAAGYSPHIHENLITAMNPQSPSRPGKVAKLVQDFTMHNPVGLIESSITLKRILELSSVFELPSVSIKASSFGGDISFDHGAFIRNSIGHLANSGRKRLLWVLKLPGKTLDSHPFDEFWKAIRATKMICEHIIEIDEQNVSRNPEEDVCEQMKMFLQKNRELSPAKRVDCVLVQEDILMRGVSVALLGEQVRVPEELLVMSQTNESIDHHYGVPVLRHESPISQMARTAVQLLTARIEHSPEPSLPILLPSKILDDNAVTESLVAA